MEHTLDIVSLEPLYAVCSCGLWSLYSFGKDGRSEVEARQEAADGHEGHLLSLRRQALLKTTGEPPR